MTDGEALLQTILDNPDDDVLRLVYADFLEETGELPNLARAEFIRLQCEIGRLESTETNNSEVDPIRKRANQILEEYEDVWLPWRKPNEPITDWTWEKGFISEITEITEKHFFAAAPVIFAEHPVRLLRPFEVAADEPSLSHLFFKFHCFSRLRELDLSQSHFHGSLCRSPEGKNLKSLRNLYLNHTWMNADSLEELLDEALIQQLAILDLRSTCIYAEGVQYLIRAKGLEKLQKLLLGECEYIGEPEKRLLRKRFGHRVRF